MQPEIEGPMRVHSLSVLTVAILTLAACAGEDDSQVGGSEVPARDSARILHVPDEWKTIQQALDAAQSGDTVQVHSGTYSEVLRITKPLVLRGTPGAKVMVGATDSAAIAIRAADVVVQDFDVQGGVSSIIVHRSENLRLIGNRISDFRTFGIAVGLSSGSVERNHVTCEGGPKPRDCRGLAIFQSEITVRENEIDGTSVVGIWVVASDAVLAGNRISIATGIPSGTGTGILIEDGSRAELSDNRIAESGRWGLMVTDTSRVTSVRDDIRSTRDGPGAGVLVQGGAEVRMTEGAVLGGADSGVLAAGGARLELLDSRVEENDGIGVWFDDKATGAITGTRIASNRGIGVLVADTSSVQIDDIEVVQTGLRSGENGNQPADGIQVMLSGRAEILDSVVSQNGKYGISVYHQGCAVVHDTEIIGNGWSGTNIAHEGSRLVLTESTVAGNAGAGISVGNGAEVILIDNEIDANGQWSVWVSDDSKSAGYANRLAGNVQGFSNEARPGVPFSAPECAVTANPLEEGLSE